jgi:hypothetical protein
MQKFQRILLSDFFTHVVTMIWKFPTNFGIMIFPNSLGRFVHNYLPFRMGNAASNPILHDATSDRELARQLLENKRIRSVQFAESDVSIVDGGPPSSDASHSLHAKNLRSNLMRVQNDRDPMVYYEIMRVVGVGSMGSVAMVRKRGEMIGGSARRNLVKSLRRQKTANECFRIPIVGELFRQCFEAVQPKRNSNHDSSRVYSHQDESINSVYDNESSESSGTKKVSPLYALKSIHLNRLGDESFVEELKNEIEILKSLVSSTITPVKGSVRFGSVQLI